MSMTVEARALHHHEAVMGTVVTFTLYPKSAVSDPSLFLRIAKARALLHRADAVFTTWSADSPISRLRRNEIDVSECPNEVGEVLEQCAMMRELTEGWFDPWAMPGGFDPSGLVKGWAAERALRVLESPALDGAIVNAAGDIATFGAPPGMRSFRVGVVDPTNSRALACTVDVPGAVATSGTYERGPHLIDPRLGRPGTRCASATVTGPSLSTADALATALAVAGVEGLGFVDRLDKYQGLVIEHDGSMSTTDGFPRVGCPISDE